MTDNLELLELRDISKRFGAVQALQDVNLTLKRGEILGLVGDNAAGKSTLMKILTGVYQPDQGQILFNTKKVHITNPDNAKRLGIEMIYQDFSLAPNLNVVDNVFLGREETKSFFGIKILNRRKMEQLTLEALNHTNIRMVSVKTHVNKLSGGQIQGVAIARAIAFYPKIIIMDEPTANLSVKVIPPLLDLMKELKDKGTSIIFITHRLQDVFSVCDRIMVLRQGVLVGDSPANATDLDELTALITGACLTFGSESKVDSGYR